MRGHGADRGAQRPARRALVGATLARAGHGFSEVPRIPAGFAADADATADTFCADLEQIATRLCRRGGERPVRVRAADPRRSVSAILRAAPEGAGVLQG